MRRAKVKQHYPAFYACHTFYGSWRFILIFTRFHHLSICRARGILTVPTEHISWRYILVLFSHPFIGLAGNLCPSAFRCNIPVVFYRLNTIYITRSQNTTKFYCTVLYNMLHNYMFWPFFGGHHQVVSA